MGRPKGEAKGVGQRGRWPGGQKEGQRGAEGRGQREGQRGKLKGDAKEGASSLVTH